MTQDELELVPARALIRAKHHNSVVRELRRRPTYDEVPTLGTARGALDSTGELPSGGNTTGDWFAVNGTIWMWSGTEWTNQGALTVGPQGDPAALRLKGTKATTGDLPTVGNVFNDVWIVEADGHGYGWTADHEWVDLGTMQGPQGPSGEDTVLRARVDPGGDGDTGKVLRWGESGPVYDYGDMLFADDYGLSSAASDADRKTALNAGIAAAASLNKTLYVSDGTYALGTAPAIVIPEDVQIVGAGTERTIFTFTTGTCLVVGDGTSAVFHNQISDLKIDGPGEGTAGTVGLHIREGRHGTYNNLGIEDCETGVLCDGEDTWTDANTFETPILNRTKFGFRFTADATFQSNNNRILHGSIYGNDPKTSGGIGVWVELGDSNVIVGTDIEDYETAVFIESPNSGGNSAVYPRIENCTNDIVVDSGVVNTMLVGHKQLVAGANGTVVQYGSRLLMPHEDTLPTADTDARGMMTRRHPGGGNPDQLRHAVTRGGGETKWTYIPTVDRELPEYLSNVGMHPANITDVTALTSGEVHMVYIGRAPITGLTTCTLYTNVTTAAGTITWAEVAIYRGDSPTTVRRVGYTNVAATFNSTGRKDTVIALADVMSGDPLWVAYGSSATTPFQLRACLPDDIESGVHREITGRPSTIGNFTGFSNPWDVTGEKPAWVTVRV